MSLNIKDSETHKLAQTLAAETGESMTRAVNVALRERLARVRKSHDAGSRAARLLAIGKEFASHMQGPDVDHGEMLYDENGLPK
jgi:antitoxin VapB